MRTHAIFTLEPRMLIDGELTLGRRQATFEDIAPATEEVLGEAVDAGAADMDAAIAAARRAFDQTDWSRNQAFRARCLRQLHAALHRSIDELRWILTAEAGTPRWLTYEGQLDGPVRKLLL